MLARCEQTQRGRFGAFINLFSFLNPVEGGGGQHAAKRFSPGRKKMSRVKCGLCDPPRVIPHIHMLIKYKYSSSPTSSAFQLGGFFEGRKKRELKVCACHGKVSVSYKKCRVKR